ncbi:MAG: peptidyl-prolyl cis-trans isomerase [Deltaproteobacteria bacterium]|nr:peptidyl-prolyl cis-trans isomerase [Deltaproteobacteria bacterium]
MRWLAVCTLVSTSALALGCAPLATSPSWAGGGMSVTGPVGVPRFEPDVPVDEVAEDTGETIGARHILVMHLGSQARPESVVRSRDEALARAREVLGKLKAGADFAALVDAYSDEPGAAERGGDLGVFPRNAMVKPFSDAAFKLTVGELSDVVETRYGFHVIKRTK